MRTCYKELTALVKLTEKARGNEMASEIRDPTPESKPECGAQMTRYPRSACRISTCDVLAGIRFRTPDFGET